MIDWTALQVRKANAEATLYAFNSTNVANKHLWPVGDQRDFDIGHAKAQAEYQASTRAWNEAISQEAKRG